MKNSDFINKRLHEELQHFKNRVFELENLAVTDSLTGLYNNRYFKDRLDQEIERSKRYKKPLCLLMIDIDDFKKCNDTHGHLEGDCLIIEISKMLTKESRLADIVCRYAGDEFVIILPEADVVRAKIYANKIRVAVNELELKCKPSISIGICELAIGMDTTSIIDKADKAMYKAKHAGKNRISDLVEVL
ncbi:MAG: GGDEF domain-containing protein [Candidatus Omnitrophica bacterium]|nr:GGDEF domain-containing protein [Candidatus Omnitrophota bacterium]MBU1996143.1 GGDEF domain-containing protein [Candidatus Omnitrophota bacterium]MBU4334828.1 GGDEF domain-containing protein [Candidatus Omnitrophota bacterium]